MHILMVFPYAPEPPPRDLGGTKRNLPFLEENLRRHDVTVVAIGSEAKAEALRDHLRGRRVSIEFVDLGRRRWQNAVEFFWLLLTLRSPYRQFFRKEMQAKIDELTRTTTFDVVHCCTQLLGYFTFPPGVPVVTDTHEVTHDLHHRLARSVRNPFRRFLFWLQYRLGKPEEIRLCKKFDWLIATTPRDAEVFARLLPGQQITVVGNGVDRSFYDPPAHGPEEDLLVFTGNMGHYPNEEGILFFVNEVLPLIVAERPHTRVEIVGVAPSRRIRSLASDRILVTGYVPDVRPFIWRASVFIIPLLTGGGIRGKALEAMAMRKAIVSTGIGCEGILLKDGESALIADGAEAFAAATLRVMADKDLAREISTRAFETVRQHYDWGSQGVKLEEVYRLAIQKKGRPKG